jgi:hypothetical protein
MIDELMWSIDGMIIHRETRNPEVLAVKPVPVSFCPIQTPYGLP